MAQRNLLTVFLASPGDLQPERNELHKVVHRLNKSVASLLGWHVDLLGWEDTSPGYYRPQEKINEDVDKCDLFIGLIWQRWGQATGKHYTSGFHEEFERAVERRRSTQSPEIWLFFKKVAEDRILDPGDQLRQVLDFRKKQEAQKELLYQEFADLEDWSRKAYDFLAKHIIQLARSVDNDVSESSTPLHSEPSSVASSNSGGNDSEEAAAAKQLLDVLRSFISSLEKGEYGPGEARINNFPVARLSLFSSSWLSEIYSHDFLGAHNINFLYRQRDHLKLQGFERITLLRTVVGNSDATAPGWYWFQKSRKEHIVLLLSLLALNDHNSEVRKRSIKILAATKQLPARRFFDRQEFLGSLLEKDPLEASEYLSQIGGVSDLAMLADARSAPLVGARICILAKHDPQAALEWILDTKALSPPPALEELQAKASLIAEEVLSRALTSPLGQIRKLSFRELARRHSLTRDQALTAQEDVSREIRQLALEWRISEGETVEPDLIRKLLKTESRKDFLMPSFFSPVQEIEIDPDRLVRKSLECLQLEEIDKHVSWFSPEGESAYAVVAENHFHVFGDTIRSDIASNFARLRDAWAAEIRSALGTEAEGVIAKYSEYDEFIRNRFLVGALSGLGRNGTEGDKELVIPHLRSENHLVAAAAIEALKKLGSREDSEELIPLAMDNSMLSRKLAASAAVKLAPGPNGAAIRLLESDDLELITIALKSLEDCSLADLDEKIENLLQHPQPTIRERGAAFLVKKGSRRYLLGLLDRYIEKEAYFYNVVCHLDGVLYAPEPIRGYFRSSLLKNLY